MISPTTTMSFFRTNQLILLRLLFLNNIVFLYTNNVFFCQAIRIAIIGGGISGTFTASYLAEYDEDCILDTIDIFDPFPIGGGDETYPSSSSDSSSYPTTTKNENKNAEEENEKENEEVEKEYRQGSRVSSIILSDGTIVDAGATIVYDGNKLVLDMIQKDPDYLIMSKVSSEFTNNNNNNDETKKMKKRKQSRGIGIYNGQGQWPLLLTSPKSSKSNTYKLLWRYNLDLIRMDRATTLALTKFNAIYDHLQQTNDNDDNNATSFFMSPNDMWNAVGLLDLSRMSYSDYLDSIGISKDEEKYSFWNYFLGLRGGGSLRRELLSGATICNYNQAISQMNGLVGLISFIPSKGQLFSIQGGNSKLMKSAFRQSQTNRNKACNNNNNNKNNNNNNKQSKTKTNVRYIPKHISNIIYDLHHAELWSDDDSDSDSDEMLGQYDTVILAAPLQQCRIHFWLKSHLDQAVLQKLPMGENAMIDSDLINANNHDDHHHHPNTNTLPKSTVMPYTQVITTFITNGTLQESYFNLTDMDMDVIPKSIYMTERARTLEGISSIGHINDVNGIYKVFSSKRLSRSKIELLFGPYCHVEVEKLWGGPYGGATPNFNGGRNDDDDSSSTSYLLFDGGLGTKGYGEGPALFYVNAIEASAAAIEISAIGAKSVAKLVARRHGLLKVSSENKHEEL